MSKIEFRQKSVEHLDVIGTHDTWETPNDLLQESLKKYEVPATLDVCTTKLIAKRHGFKYFYTTHNNGLKKNWKRSFFMNCPYSEIDRWMERAFLMFFRYGKKSLILTYAKTDTRWWHKYVEHNENVRVHFVKGRIRFWLNGKKSKNSAPYPSVMLVLDPNRGQTPSRWRRCPNCGNNYSFEI